MLVGSQRCWSVSVLQDNAVERLSSNTAQTNVLCKTERHLCKYKLNDTAVTFRNVNLYREYWRRYGAGCRQRRVPKPGGCFTGADPGVSPTYNHGRSVFLRFVVLSNLSRPCVSAKRGWVRVREFRFYEQTRTCSSSSARTLAEQKCRHGEASRSLW